MMTPDALPDGILVDGVVNVEAVQRKLAEVVIELDQLAMEIRETPAP